MANGIKRTDTGSSTKKSSKKVPTLEFPTLWSFIFICEAKVANEVSNCVAPFGCKIRAKGRDIFGIADGRKSGDIITYLKFIPSPHFPLLVALQGQKGLKTRPNMTLKYMFHLLGHKFVKQKELPRLFVCKH